MHKCKVLFLLYLVVSTQAFSIPEGPVSSENGVPHRLHKRDADAVHPINIIEAKEEIMMAYQEIKPILDELVSDIAPSIQQKFAETYLPAIQSLRDEVMPFFYAKIYPQVQKYFKFGLHIAEKLVDKTYRAYKLSNSTHLAVISVSDLIDEIYNELRPVLEMGRYLSARMMMNNGQSRGRRYVPQGSFAVNSIEEIHVIDIQNVKDSLIKAYQAVKPLLEKLLSEVSPSIYEEFDSSYFPKIREIIDVISPFFQSKYYSQVQKYFLFASHVTEKLVDRAYRSYQLSNSTHINIVSILDVIEEIYTEFKPILDLAKYLSTRMSMSSKHYRGKRDVSSSAFEQHMPDFLMAIISPFVEDFARSLTDTFFGGSTSLLSKVAMPFIYDVLGDPESRFDVYSLCTLVKAAFSPLFLEMVKVQNYNTSDGTIIRIPRHMFDNAVEQIRIESRPIVRKLLNKHLGSLFRYAYKSSDEVANLVVQLIFEKYDGADVLLDQYFAFIHKHKGLFKTSTSTYVHYYPLKEIVNDLVPLKASVAKVLAHYLHRNPNSWLNKMFGESSFLQNLISGAPIFPKQVASNTYAKADASSTYVKPPVYNTYAKPAASSPRVTPVYKYVKRG